MIERLTLFESSITKRLTDKINPSHLLIIPGDRTDFIDLDFVVILLYNPVFFAILRGEFRD